MAHPQRKIFQVVKAVILFTLLGACIAPAPGIRTPVVIPTEDPVVVATQFAATQDSDFDRGPVLPIGTVQGAVPNTTDGLRFRSPYAPPNGNSDGDTVTIQGVIYALTTSFSSSGTVNHGFFLQNPAQEADGDPLTSDGLFVFYGRFDTLRGEDGGFYTPRVGDEVRLHGPVVEYYNLTQLSNPYLVRLIRTGVDVDLAVPAFEANPPAGLAESNRYWERREGMRALIPTGSLVLAGRSVFAGTDDGEVWVANPHTAIAQQNDPYSRRAFRDPHPMDDLPTPLFDNGNGYRILLGSHGIKATLNDPEALIAPARTFDTLSSARTGGVYFSFDKYQVMVSEQLDLKEGVNPAGNAPPEAPDLSHEYSIATYNLENLYDYRDDPFDSCDFKGNPGCAGVSPPFDYIPLSDTDYQARLDAIAEQIVAALHSPDLLMVQEVEDQDICSLSGNTESNDPLTCGASNHADGRSDPLQDLALAIDAHGGPTYEPAYDPDGADTRGIVSAFLFRTDRVQLLPVEPGEPLLGNQPDVQYRGLAAPYNTDVQNPKALNAELPGDVDLRTGVDGGMVFTRAPQVGHFRIWQNGVGSNLYIDLYAINNHFSSGPDQRVGQRTEQAVYNAALAAALLASNPDVPITLGGDLNVFPRPDDPFSPGDSHDPSDQLASLYEQGLINLYSRLLKDAPSSAYSYVYQGQAQTLDQMFVNPAMLGELVSIRAAHLNADWPAGDPADGPHGTSDHDPQVARYRFLPTSGSLSGLDQEFERREATSRYSEGR